MKKEEHNLQCQIVEILRLSGFFVFAIPNGGQRNISTASQLKKEGVLAGTSDLIIVLKNKIIFVEMKTEKGKQQETQKIFQEEIEKRHHIYMIWKNVDDCMKFIEKYNLEK